MKLASLLSESNEDTCASLVVSKNCAIKSCYKDSVNGNYVNNDESPLNADFVLKTETFYTFTFHSPPTIRCLNVSLIKICLVSLIFRKDKFKKRFVNCW